MSEEKKAVTADPAVIDKVDSNGDGHISHEEMECASPTRRWAS